MHRMVLVAVLAVAAAVFGLRPGDAVAGPGLVFDARTGNVLYAEDAGRVWYPASLTKMMTAYIVFRQIEAGRLSPNSEIVISANAAAQPPSKIGLPAGTAISVDFALRALLVRSANDIAVTIAENLAGSETAFVRHMNEVARALGMSGTYYANPHGLPDIRQVTTARDIGILARAIIHQFPDQLHYFAEPHVKVGDRVLGNRNSLLKTMEGADGMKTGFICNSGYNLVATATRNGRKLVAVVLGETSANARNERAATLLEAAFARAAGHNLSFSSRPVSAISNGGLVAAPEDLGAVVCNRDLELPPSPADRVKAWSVVLAEADSVKASTDLLRKRLMPLRGVFYGGHTAVVKSPLTGRYAALVHGLDADQARAACSTASACRVLEPDTFQRAIAAARAAEQEARRQQEAKKKPQAEKPQARGNAKPAPKPKAARDPVPAQASVPVPASPPQALNPAAETPSIPKASVTPGWNTERWPSGLRHWDRR